MKKRFLLLFSLVGLGTLSAQVKATKFNLLVGTYTNKCESKGIYTYEFDSKTGDLKLKNTTESVISPNYISVSRDKKFVYAANADGENSAVSAFKFEPNSGKLTFLNKEKTVDANNPCYIIDDERNVITANYSSGNLSVFAKKPNGSLNEQKQLMQHTGKGPNTKRQEKSHIHMVDFSPDHKYVVATDLGSDKVFSYQYTRSSAESVVTLLDSISLKPGCGPHHFTFSKDGKLIYVLNELDGTISTLKFKESAFELGETISILAEGFKQNFTAADIHISPDNTFLYVTNRKEANDISCFKILSTGNLSFVSRTSTLGDGPRNFTFDPTGNFLLVAHQYSNTIIVFKRDKTTGLLTDSGKKAELCSPVCLKFAN